MPLPGRGKHRRIKPGDTYTDDDEGAELEAPEADALQLPEADQHGDPEHEGAPPDDEEVAF
jgi:hypothetical protein